MSEANLLLIRVSIGATQKNPSRQNQKRPPTLKVSTSGYFAWLKRLPCRRQQERESLKLLVQNIQENHRNSCGSRRMA
jgi:hypothetical protein